MPGKKHESWNSVSKGSQNETKLDAETIEKASKVDTKKYTRKKH
jgi:hypothetical protein